MPRARAIDSAKELRVWLLGGFRVAVGDREIPSAAWRLRKARNLIKLLALAPGHRLHREQVIELLWPHLDPEAASNNLRKVLHIARRTLELPRSSSAVRYLQVQDDVLSLAPHGLLWVDVDAFDLAVGEARRRRDVAAYQAALDLYVGDLLPEDRYEDWSGSRRETLSQEYLSLLADLATIYESNGEYTRAIEALQQLLSRDAGREEAQRSLMRLYALSGQRQHALRQYQVLREALHREFEAEPEAASRRLHDDIVANRFPLPESQGLRLTRPSLDFRSTGRTNLPLQLTSFVGRAREMAELQDRIASHRQLTLSGAAGVGKTRLALEVAARVLQDFPDGVWLVDLSVLADAALVPQGVASVLSIREEAGQPLTTVLGDYLLAKHALLLLDNCEHVAGACAQLAEYLLRRCPDVHVVATSREILGMEGELVYRVSSLSAPDVRRSPPIEELVRYEAVRLFVDRAALSQPGFALTDGNALMVARICAHLDGIPLAIELAAARLKALTVEAIATRLDNRFRLLTGGTRTALSRHQTLVAAMDWSYDLLPEPERALLRRLSVFAGGFTLEAAQAVGAREAIDEMDVLNLLARLVDKSMVLLEKQPLKVRYRLLETVREYIRNKLVEAGEADAARRQLGRFFLGLSEEAESELRGADQAVWLDRLEAEHDNLRAALEWSLGQEADDTGLRMAAALSGYWHARGYLSEGREWLERALSHNSTSARTSRMKVLIGAARLAFAQDDFGRAVTIMEEAVPLARAGGDRQALTLLLAWLGHAMWHQGDRARGIALCQESHAMCGTVGDTWTNAVALAEVATVALHQGIPQRAVPLLEESLTLFRKVGDMAGIAQCLYQLGIQATDQADYPRAAALMEEALGLQRQLGRKPAVATSLGRLGRIALMRGDYEQAVALLEAGITLADELGKKWDSAYRKAGLGLAALAQGDVVRAGALFEESLAIQRGVGDNGGVAESLAGLGIVARYDGDYGRARRLLEESLASLRESGSAADAATPLYHLGVLACSEGDDKRASDLLRESLAQRKACGNRLGMVECLEAIAAVARSRGESERAARLLGAVEVVREAVGAPRWPIDQARRDRDVAELRMSLGEEGFIAASASGRAMTLDQAIELAFAPS
jgi:predicted ATPase/DNA-binding SARP family transcriptional activator